MKSIEILTNRLASLRDSYQHYTMVDKDKDKAFWIKNDIEEAEILLNELNELKRLKDLEKELGCPLEVFVNIFKYGVIVSDDNYEAKGFSEWQQQNIEIDIKNKCFSVYCIGTWKFRDYGKTWWLKGEKENV